MLTKQQQIDSAIREVKKLVEGGFIGEITFRLKNGDVIHKTINRQNMLNAQVAKTISLIIPLKNRFAHLCKLLKSLGEVTHYERVEVVIVDFESTDVKWDQKIEDPYTLVSIPPPFRRAKALNIGASFATGNVLFFCDADMLLPRNLVTVLENTVEDGVAYFPKCTLLIEKEQEGGVLDVGWGNCAFTRATFDIVGKWNESFIMHGGEDGDLFNRCVSYKIVQAGVRTIRSLLPGFFHQFHPTTAEYRNKYYLEGDSNV